MERDDAYEAAYQQQLEQQEMEEVAMKALFSAFVKAQAQIEKATKDKTNPHFRSKYADLASVVDAIKPALEGHGLGFIQRFHDDDRAIKVETIIIHESGEQLSCGILSIPASKQDAQGFGSACTYARRYSLQAAFGVAPEDDDGNAASRKPETKPERKTGVIKATDGAVESLSHEDAEVARSVSTTIIEKARAGDERGAYEAYAAVEDIELRVAIWALLAGESKIRSAIKRIGEQERATA